MTRRPILPMLAAVLAAAVIGARFTSSLTSFAASPTPADPPTMPPQSSQSFSFALWEAVQRQSDATNRIISPVSAQVALSMLYNGARGTTQTAMAQTLAVTGIPMETVNAQAQEMLARLTSAAEPQVQLAVANSLWLNQGIPIQPPFIQFSQQYYQAEVRTLPFTAAALETINGWARDKTQGRIPMILDEIDPRGVAYLLNAVYFKGDWTRAFDPNLTQPAPFTLENGDTIQHPLMSQTGTFAYLETETFQGVRLPYGRSGALAMTVILPKQNLESFYAQLNPSTWQTWTNEFTERPGSLRLPRFETSATFDLQPILTQMGMGIAFTGAADFGGLTPEPAAISKAIQKTFMEVNETGTEAAAVTAIGITRTSIQVPRDQFTMVVNRPFFLVISSGEDMLFMGEIRDPRG